MSTVHPGHRNLPLLLLHAREAAMAHFRPILKHHGLTDQQWRIVRALATAGELEPGQIAEACKILPPSLSGILSRLDSMDLVTRSGSEVDQRRQIIRLTPAGNALVKRMLPLIEEQYRRIEAALGEQTLAAIYATLDQVLAVLERDIASVMEDGVDAPVPPRRASSGRVSRSSPMEAK